MIVPAASAHFQQWTDRLTCYMKGRQTKSKKYQDRTHQMAGQFSEETYPDNDQTPRCAVCHKIDKSNITGTQAVSHVSRLFRAKRRTRSRLSTLTLSLLNRGQLYASHLSLLTSHLYNTSLTASYTPRIPSSSPIFAFHPKPCNLLTSISLRGVPSGLLRSCSMVPV